MLEFWATLKIWSEYIIPIALFVLIVLWIVIKLLIDCFKWSRKEKWLMSHGYKRFVLDVSSSGNKVWYGWQNKQNGVMIRQSMIEKLSYQKFITQIQKMEGNK